MERPRCLWCHETRDIMYEKMVLTISRLGMPRDREAEYFCSQDCYQKADRFLNRCARFSVFSIVVLTLVLVSIFFSFWFARTLHLNHRVFLGLSILPAAILLEMIPFTTPETIRMVGMEKGTWMMRMVGGFMIFISMMLFLLT